MKNEITAAVSNRIGGHEVTHVETDAEQAAAAGALELEAEMVFAFADFADFLEAGSAGHEDRCRVLDPERSELEQILEELLIYFIDGQLGIDEPFRRKILGRNVLGSEFPQSGPEKLGCPK